MNVSVAKVRRAAEQLRASNQDVTILNLRSVLKVTTEDLKSLFRIKGVKQELGIVTTRSDHKTMPAQYKAAAKRLSEKNIPVTPSSLASEMNSTPQAVSMWLQRHPLHKDEFEVVSEGAGTRLKRAAAYEMAVEILRTSNKRVTKDAIAKITNYNKSYISRDFKKNPDLKKLLSSKAESTKSA